MDIIHSKEKNKLNKILLKRREQEQWLSRTMVNLSQQTKFLRSWKQKFYSKKFSRRQASLRYFFSNYTLVCLKMSLFPEHEQFADETARYLDKNGIYDLFSDLLQDLVLNKPTDPLSHLLTQLETPPSKENIILYGLPRRTRDDVATRFSDTGLVKVSVFELLSAEMKDSKNAFATQILRSVKQRQVPPVELVVPFLQLRLKKQDCKKNGWVLTDFPNTPEEALALQQAGIVPSHFISFEGSDEDILANLQEVTVDLGESAVPLLISAQLPTSIAAYKNNYRDISNSFKTSLITINTNQARAQVWSDVVQAIRAPPISQAPSVPKKV